MPTSTQKKTFPARRPLLTLPAPSDATPEQIAAAFAACRSIRFANDQAVRHGGDYSLNDLLAADRLAREALQGRPATTKAGKECAA